MRKQHSDDPIHYRRPYLLLINACECCNVSQNSPCQIITQKRYRSDRSHAPCCWLSVHPKHLTKHVLTKNKRTSVIVSNTVRTTRLLSAIVNPYSALIISPMASRLSAWSSLGSVLNAREDDVKMGDEPTVGRIHLNDATEAVALGMCRESEEIMVGVITLVEKENYWGVWLARDTCLLTNEGGSGM